MLHSVTIPTFGEFLRFLRLNHELTQAELAQRLSVDISYVSKLENSKTDHVPSDRLIEDLASTFGDKRGGLRLKLYVLAGKLPPEVHRQIVEDKLERFRAKLFR